MESLLSICHSCQFVVTLSSLCRHFVVDLSSICRRFVVDLSSLSELCCQAHSKFIVFHNRSGGCAALALQLCIGSLLHHFRHLLTHSLCYFAFRSNTFAFRSFFLALQTSCPCFLFHLPCFLFQWPSFFLFGLCTVATFISQSPLLCYCQIFWVVITFSRSPSHFTSLLLPH